MELGNNFEKLGEFSLDVTHCELGLSYAHQLFSGHEFYSLACW